MNWELTWPGKREDSEKVYKKLVDLAIAERNPRLVRWRMSHFYMQGARYFDALDFQRGTVQIGYTDESGRLHFVYEELVARFQAQKGRLMNMDLSPRVTREIESLNGQRKASVGQVVLQSIFTPKAVDELKDPLISALLMYGTIALRLWKTDSKQFTVEVLEPWTLLPIPANPSSPKNVRGLIVREMVPVEYVRRLIGSLPNRGTLLNEMKTIELPRGDLPDGLEEDFDSGGLTIMSLGDFFDARAERTTQPTMKGSDRGKTEKVAVTELGVVYLLDQANYLMEQKIFAGGKLVAQEGFGQSRIYSPIKAVQDVSAGGFWGRSFVEICMPTNVEVENMIGRAFQNVQEMDLYGMMLWPTTLGASQGALSQGRDGLKVLRFEPDYTSPHAETARPMQVTPVNSGLLPAKLIDIGVGIGDRIANQPTSLTKGEAPGRVDSASALGFLNETSNIPLSPTAHAIAMGMSHIYRATLGVAASEWRGEDVVRITMLDDSIAGIKFDPERGELRVAENAIPHPDEVNVTVQSMMPVSRQQRVLELKDHLDRKIITPFEYRIQARKLNLDLPVANDGEWHNYCRAVIENLVMYGDGQEGGQTIQSDEADMHMVHLYAHMAFVGRPEFYLAEQTIRDRFLEHIRGHQESLGRVPDQMPFNEDAAEEAMAMMNSGGTAAPPVEMM